MAASDIPGFAFREAPDGSITWGASWEPGPNAEPEVRISQVHAWLVPDLAPRLAMSLIDCCRLCEEAGYR